MGSNAFVTFVMLNDHFIPGALVFAYALRKQRVSSDLVCLITPNISAPAKTALHRLFDVVIEIDPLVVPNTGCSVLQARSFLFTRFQVFRLGKDGDLGRHYDKLVISDADILPIKDYESLFEVPAPAGILNESKEHCIASADGQFLDTTTKETPTQWHWHRLYAAYPHGSSIPELITNRVCDDIDNMGINSCLYRIDPNIRDYQAILSDIEDVSYRQLIQKFRWPEMQYLSHKFSGSWHNIDLSYASFEGYPKLSILKGTHFAGLKPWNINHPSVRHYAKYPDFQLFFKTYLDMIQRYPKLLEYRRLNRIAQHYQSWIKAE